MRIGVIALNSIIFLVSTVSRLLFSRVAVRIYVLAVPCFIVGAMLLPSDRLSPDSLKLLNLQAEAATEALVDGQVVIDVRAPELARPIRPELFGINTRWLDNGDGIIEYGEMIRDRSFRNQSDASLRKWLEFPEPRINGEISFVQDSPPHSGTLADISYPGHVNLSQDAEGYTCISQQVLGDSIAGERYELNLSARRVSGSPALTAFFADNDFLPIEEVDNFAVVTEAEWQNYTLVLQPGQQISPGLLRICSVSPGSVDVDEIRLRRQGQAPGIKSAVDARIKELGVRAMRWPVGTDADRFLWKQAIGPLSSRGENIGTFGQLQTASYGLHEFLDYCEANDILPLITVNITDDPANSADLLEYILGDSTSEMGALRSQNGRSQPWNVRYFELGNEPSQLYQAGRDYDNTSLGYLELAQATAVAMRQQAEELGAEIDLQGTLDATFAEADWISTVPMLAQWNDNVLDPSGGLVPYIDQIKGNFYSGFTYSMRRRRLYDEIMAGGATLERIVAGFNEQLEPDLPFWLTEYSLLVQQNTPQRIIVARSKDFQAGLSVADIMMTAVAQNFGGAFLFNLAEDATWGVLTNHIDYRLRPTGLSFSMLAHMADQRLLPVDLGYNQEVEIRGGDGNNPSDIAYDEVSVLATYGDKDLQIFVLNRHYNEAKVLAFSVQGFLPDAAQTYLLSSDSLHDSNDEEPGTVQIIESDLITEPNLLSVPPRSLTRLVVSGQLQ